MLNTQRISKHLCFRCFNTLVHRRKFQTVAEATSYQQNISRLDPQNNNLRDNSWMGYLTSLSDIDIKASVTGLTNTEASRVFQLLLTQKPHPLHNTELKNVISSIVSLDQSITSNVLAGLIAYFYHQ